MPASIRPRLPRRFYQRDSRLVARALIGQRLVRIDGGRRLAGTIVETEAYLGLRDKAAHSHGHRRTARNESMWADGGTAYVYFTYGMHHCLNVSARTAGVPQAVLIRAIEPTEGLEAMQTRRTAAKRPTDLCSGPAKLCEAMRVDLTQDRLDLCQSPTLFIEQARARAYPRRMITTTARVGIAYAEEWTARPLRYYLTASQYVSPPRLVTPRQS